MKNGFHLLVIRIRGQALSATSFSVSAASPELPLSAPPPLSPSLARSRSVYLYVYLSCNIRSPEKIFAHLNKTELLVDCVRWTRAYTR